MVVRGSMRKVVWVSKAVRLKRHRRVLCEYRKGTGVQERTPKNACLLFSKSGLRVEVEYDVDQGPDNICEESSARHFADHGRHHLSHAIGFGASIPK